MERLLWIFVVVVLLLVGVVVFASSASEPTDFGWFAYTPLESPEPSSDVLLVSRGQIVGCVVALLGLLLLAAGLGYRAGARRGATPSDPAA